MADPTAMTLGTAAVTYAATLLTAWAAFFRQMKEMREGIKTQEKRLVGQEEFDKYEKDQEKIDEEIKTKHADVEKRLSIAETKIVTLEKSKDEFNGKFERIQERMAKLATAEELTTLSNRNAEQFLGLSERLGRVIGALEQWRPE